MDTKNNVASDIVAAVYYSRVEANTGIRALEAAGFPNENIGLITREPEAKSGLEGDPTNTRWEEGTGVGAAVGAATGAGMGLAVAAGLLTPVGPLIAGGALVALLASVGAGATVGTAVGGLIGLGIPEDDATYFETEMEQGRTIVTVQTQGRQQEARRIMQVSGGAMR